MRKNIGVFRGKRKDNGEWVQGNYLCLHQSDDTDLHIIVDEHGIYNPIDPETVGEETGMTDANGLSVFEGDIVEFDNGFTSLIGKIAFSKGSWVMGDIGYLYVYMRNNAILIGNIHDNPELLGGTK